MCNIIRFCRLHFYVISVAFISPQIYLIQRDDHSLTEQCLRLLQDYAIGQLVSIKGHVTDHLSRLLRLDADRWVGQAR